jgi:hypothetical protein
VYRTVVRASNRTVSGNATVIKVNVIVIVISIIIIIIFVVVVVVVVVVVESTDVVCVASRCAANVSCLQIRRAHRHTDLASWITINDRIVAFESVGDSH